MSRTPLPPITLALDPGPASWSIRRRSRDLAARFERPPIDPVIPLCGPFLLDRGAGLVQVRAVLDEVVPRVPFLECHLDGYAVCADGRGGSIGFSVRPSPELREITASIDRAMDRIASPRDAPAEHLYVPAARFDGRAALSGAARSLGLSLSLWDRLARLFRRPSPPPPGGRRPIDVTRLLVMAGDRPFAGLDLGPRRWLHAAELRDRSVLAASLGAYRLARGYELASPSHRAPGETWLLGDLHLGHPEISLYCARPFLSGDTGEHDRVLVQNWRHTVQPDDRAVLLGDVCAFPDPDTFLAAIAGLPGRLEVVRGNHDPALPGLVSHLLFESDGLRFLAVHDPADAPPDFDGWVIHGHHHDADLERFPFFDPVSRRVNVSAETAGYSPVPLSLVCRLARERSGRLTFRETVPA